MELILAYDRPNDMLELVKEYTDIILEQGDDVKRCLQSQKLDQELADMEHKYGLPDGRMYIALVDGKVAGSVALTKNDAEYCEIKRLYIRPAFRGRGLAKPMVEQILADARSIGYKYMRLDTFPFMEAAIRLYESYGFYPIERYNDNPAKTAMFFQLDL